MERIRPAGDAEVERTDRSGPVCAASVADGCGPEDGLILQTGGELMALKWRFSRLLYTWRRENELTQEEAAERCGGVPPALSGHGGRPGQPQAVHGDPYRQRIKYQFRCVEKRGERDSCSISTARMSAR